MKKLIIIFLLSPIFVKAQMDSGWSLIPQSSTITGEGWIDSGWISVSASGNIKMERDTCQWESRMDTIHVDFIITVDSMGFLRKKDVKEIIHKYEEEVCTIPWYLHKNNRNEVYLVDNKPTEILMYWEKRMIRFIIPNN